MENLSATSLYVQACKFLLCGEDRSSWDQLVAILPQLRNALTCRVCRGLIVDPLSSGYCQHYVCRNCLQRKRALNPGCKWCLDFSKLNRSDEQIRVVLACYKLLCKEIRLSNYYVTSTKNLVIENLLEEAELNADVLPNSSRVVSNNYNVKSKTSDENMAVDVVSREQLEETCAREKVDVKLAENDDEKVNLDTEEIPEIAINGIAEDESSVKQHETSVTSAQEINTPLVTDTCEIGTDINSNIDCSIMANTNGISEGNPQLPNGVKIEANDFDTCNCSNSTSTVLDTGDQLQDVAIKIETDNIKTENMDCGELNNGNNEEIDSNTNNNPREINNTETKTNMMRKMKIKNKRVGLRPRNGQSVQKFEAGRYMRKRKLAAQTHQNNRPRKKCKIGLTT
ncbi:putative uncharacterized protein DDB_G0282133 [Dendronephthya gigantea]|uniref:putative uncharacterized protein DDB_G0282133 n=1 Tax=Dendronephthya gigantea TaxID=151771 RepID=UPI00106B54B1|nr:putative uncharacterized protein DDB_G0282133 [Dendronephthya gigantea]